MKRRTMYYAARGGRRRRGKGARRWLLAAVCAGLALYIGLAMGLGTWVHDSLLSLRTPEENEILDGEGSVPEPETDAAITETVAFPAIEMYALGVEGFADKEEADYNASLYAARGGAGFVLDKDGEYAVLLAAYDSLEAAQNVAQNLQDEENVPAAVRTLAADGVELKITAQASRIDGIRDAFSIWQQTVQMLSDLWQDVDAGLCSLTQAVDRIEDQCGKLEETAQAAFSDALIEGAAPALQGLYSVLQGTIADMEEIVSDPPEFVLEVSAQIKYTGIKSLTEYQSYVESLKAQGTSS